MNELLEKWELERDWTEIQKKTHAAWKREVRAAAEKRNLNQRKKISEECEVKSRGEIKIKTKTKHAADTIADSRS